VQLMAVRDRLLGLVTGFDHAWLRQVPAHRQPRLPRQRPRQYARSHRLTSEK
jgi:hypothetical protein